MIENELERIWRNSTKEEVVKFNTSKLLIDLDSQLKSFDRCIINRDRREIIAAVIVIPIFGIASFFIPQVLSKMGLMQGFLYGMGLLLGILYCILVIYVLRNVRKHKADNYSISIKEYLIKHRQYIIKERSLLENVLYWFILPPAISTILIFIGLNMGSTRIIILILIIMVFNAFVYFLNKRTVKKDFDPLIKKLDLTIKDFETID